MIKECLECQKDYHTKPCLINKSKFCSRICKIKYSTGKHLSPKSEFKKGQKPWNTGLKGMYSNEHIEHLKELNRKGVIGIKGKKKSAKQRLNHSLGALKGDKCHFWRGGVTKENETLRKSLEYLLWRSDVFERDNYTCVFCGERGGKLNADHIKSFALFPALRFELSNGQTLCIDCHAIKTKEDMKFITREVRKYA